MTQRTLSRRYFMAAAGAAAAGALHYAGASKRASAAEPLPPVREDELVVSFGHNGSVGVEGWTWAHNEGMKAIQEAFPGIKCSYVENIPFSADATRTFRQFVASGSQIVFSTSNYGDFLYEVADRAPDVAFLECGGRRIADNLGWYNQAYWYGSYVIGVAAGAVSKSGKLGFIGSFPVPQVYGTANAFLLGARTVNPNATVQVININSWFDPQGASQAAAALADNGADFLYGNLEDASYLKIAQTRGIWAAMSNTDQRQFGPDAYVTSQLIDWRAFYVDQVKKRIEGTWTGGVESLVPLGSGIDRAPWGKSVPAEAAARADAVREKLIGGLKPYVGPLRDANGKVRIDKGQAMSELDLYNWSWPVEGVSGLPVT